MSSSEKAAAAVNRCETLHKGRVFQLDRENITLPNQLAIDIDIIRHPGASAIVPYRKETEEVILIHQYRHAVGGYIWEIPAGTLEPDESPETCARRELIEETGFSADTWQKLGAVTPVPGYSDERIHLFLAEDLAPARQHLDADEVIEATFVPLKKAMAMIQNGEIEDSKTICGLFMASAVLGG